MSRAPLDIFRAALPDTVRSRWPESAALKASLDAVWVRARAGSPAFEVTEADFFAHLARCLSSEGAEGVALSDVAAADLMLVAGCLSGNAQALTLARQWLVEALSGSLAKLRVPMAARSELESQLASELFTTAERPSPKLLEYGARGPLKAWLSVIATRAGLMVLRRQKSEVPLDDDALLGAEASGNDPELEAMKARYRGEFSAAFRDAVRGLSAKNRRLLRQHYLDGVTTEQLAGLFNVHRATAVRWLADARESLLSGTRDALVQRLGIARHEADGVLGLIQSQMHFSMPLFLSAAEPDAPPSKG